MCLRNADHGTTLKASEYDFPEWIQGLFIVTSSLEISSKLKPPQDLYEVRPFLTQHALEQWQTQFMA
jgi:hypothetical protein